jgi:hypothetical protein
VLARKQRKAVRGQFERIAKLTPLLSRSRVCWRAQTQQVAAVVRRVVHAAPLLLLLYADADRIEAAFSD